jgi:hypothetical protein
MDRSLSGFFDELEKIAVSVRMSSFMQTRSGRRPIRAHTLLKRENAFKTPKEKEEKLLSEDGEREGMKDYEVEGGPGMIEEPKTAAMAGDLRVKSPGMGKLTNPPTEDSKGFAFKQLSNAAKPGKFINKVAPKNLVGPGPSIKQVAPLPR